MQNQSYIKLAWWTMGAIFLVILAGSLVRMTGSGMGCPDWPKCFGYYIPPTDVDQVLWKPGKDYFEGQMIVHNDVLYESNADMTSATTFSPSNWTEYTKHSYAKFNAQHTWIEYVNRLAGALSGFFVLGLFVMTFLGRRKGRFKGVDVLFGLALLFLLGFQAWLGKTVVDSNLAPLKITFHMFGALAIVALLLYMIRRAQPDHGTVLPSSVKTFGWIAFAMILIQIYLGTSVRQEVDAVVAQYDHQQRDLWMDIVDQTRIFKIHRSFAWLILATVGWFLWKSKSLGAWTTGHMWIAGTLIAEVLAGVILAKLDIPALGQPTHLILACLLFSFLLWVLLGKGVEHSSSDS